MSEDLKKLPPEERLKKLKELEQKKKQEIDEAQKLIKESETEITEQRKWKEKVPIPQVAVEDSQSMSVEEKQMIGAHHQKSAGKAPLEEKKQKKTTAFFEEEEEKPKKSAQELEQLLGNVPQLPPELLGSDYAKHLSRKPMQDLYQEMAGIQSHRG